MCTIYCPMNTYTLLLLCSIVVVNGQYQITDTNGFGRRFDGIGGLSGGGATSKLLMSYNEPQRSQILDLLFKPQYGAALQILKVEIGGDSQTTDGSESSHMHEANEENYHRGYEWWLMKEAKKRNPSIALSGLPWAFPGWVGDYGFTPYKNVTKAAWYIVNWIKGARDVHNLTIDFIGIWNEKKYNTDYILELRSILNQNQLQSVKIIAPDAPASGFHSDDYNDLTQDESVLNALYAIGVHYPGTNLVENARMSPLALWASEDCSTFNDDVGAGCWARILNQNYVNGNMTSTISWNLISSYYSGLPYPRNGLMDAQQPWSGNYVIRNPIWVTAHTTHFTNVGWNYLKQGFGSGLLQNGGSYSHDHSICIRPDLPPYNVSAQDVIFNLAGKFAGISKLYVYKSQFNYDNTPSRVFERQADYVISNSAIKLHLDPDTVYTLSTINSPGRTQNDSIPPPSSFPFPYSEDFNSYNVDEEPKYLAQQNGAWEIMKISNESFVRQKALNRPIAWCPIMDTGTSALIGDNSWPAQDIAMSIKVRSPAISGSRNLFVALRMDELGCPGFSTAFFLFLNPNTTAYSISYDISSLNVLQSGSLSAPISFDTWHTISMNITGNTLSAQINADRISMQVPNGGTSGGFVGIGSHDFGYSDWDDLIIYDPIPRRATTAPSKGAAYLPAHRSDFSTIVMILASILVAKLC